MQQTLISIEAIKVLNFLSTDRHRGVDKNDIFQMNNRKWKHQLSPAKKT